MPENCVSYENAVASLKEIAGSQTADTTAVSYAKQTLDFLNQHPQTAKLLRETLSNASCSDIAQLVQGIPAGFRDSEIAQGVNELRSGLPQLTDQARTAIDGTYNGLHNDLVNFQNTVAYSSVILATALLIGFGSYAALRFTGRKTEK